MKGGFREETHFAVMTELVRVGHCIAANPSEVSEEGFVIKNAYPATADIPPLKK